MSISFDNTENAFRYRSTRALKQARLLFQFISSPLLTKIGISITNFALNSNLPIKGLVKKTIFKQFCGGESLEEAAQTASVLNRFQVGVALDYGVEGKSNEKDFDLAVPEFIKAIEYASTQPNILFIPIKITGFARFGLLEKKHTQNKLSDDEKEEWSRIVKRVNTICQVAADNGLSILIDAEHSWIQRPIDEIANQMMEKYNLNRAVVYNTFQMYLHQSLSNLHVAFQLSQKKGYILGAKIVRGAYMEIERERASKGGYQSPVQLNKSATDKDYDDAIEFCIRNISRVAVFIGTHNEKSSLKAVQLIKDKELEFGHPQIFFSQLYGMSDNITFNLAQAGCRVYKYLPYGPVKDVMPYLMRRAQENTSVAGQTNRELDLINRELKRRKR